MPARGRLPRVRSFPPVAGEDARILILGSMPGEASLAAGQYYAHPRNAFWPIMGALAGAAPELPYADRLAALAAARIAVWDVLKSCIRAGSLDSRIDHDSLAVNDFADFFRRHPAISQVFFNGAAADSLFRRHALPALSSVGTALSLRRLPSTSPANASWTFARKLDAWRAITGPA